MSKEAEGKCIHKFVFMRNEAFYKAYRYSNSFVSIDYFFCEKCLEEKTKEKKTEVTIGQPVPEWAENISKRINV